MVLFGLMIDVSVRKILCVVLFVISSDLWCIGMFSDVSYVVLVL